MDRVFKALASPIRRRILDLLRVEDGLNVNDAAAHFEISRVGVLKHINLLEEAGLVVSRREGRERLLHLNAVPIQMIYERWTTDYGRLWAGRLTRLKYEVEKEIS